MENCDSEGLHKPAQALPAGWTFDVFADPVGLSGTTTYHADVFRLRVFMCRIKLGEPYSSFDQARMALESRVHGWIADFESRPDVGS